MESVFTYYFQNNCWGNSESLSGGGSSQEQTRQIKESILFIVKKYKITVFFDVPCGDFNWFKTIVQHIPTYIGADIVLPLINKNKENFNTHTFIHFDLTKDIFPEKIDIIFCRDLFVHFSFDKIIEALRNIKKSKAVYLLTTTFINRQFTDIDVGGWRPVSLFNAPFNFPPPLELLSENCTESFPNLMDKSLGLWYIKDIPDF